MTSEKAKEWAEENICKKLCGACVMSNGSKCASYNYAMEGFDAGVNSIITKLKDEFINVPKEDILERALDDYFSGSTHFCSDDKDIEKLFNHVIDYFLRKC